MNEIVNYGIIIFAFLIVGEKEMTGLNFGSKIRAAYDCENDAKNKQIVEEIEKHIIKIHFGFNRVLSVTYK